MSIEQSKETRILVDSIAYITLCTFSNSIIEHIILYNSASLSPQSGARDIQQAHHTDVAQLNQKVIITRKWPVLQLEHCTTLDNTHNQWAFDEQRKPSVEYKPLPFLLITVIVICF
ncbi:hypothetical protein PHYBLDRAFT_64499 [Phycomyces blakesleeanus NRRL 1555(-)]|uniref:Uncharacterized protein n=1 Tax=Phycomyces blakesleeanus (strain ATCC 8743b / DSM 1359 / FGSC 10004 / NBRC 33097 / NRRL 1555) TaxID=763407 RepID=A0A167NBF7_PHYB8|nr:hypothetical protein PHYBLDRAFT_64499 [Phycomyces blakesleeanus NRRL 1555(-)]OAD75590.1 hypothetical protein PHYBLDRAFT_64499 [Phycomyces blakesleeanus NRRL 1555(-)]|eukprot:XP_018293630.1 hypothetical protein PHYBLDRAFT_64499 [Phycomyces blakesleeanus NRRL 1555(-)]